MDNNKAVETVMNPIWNSVTLESMIKFAVMYFFVVWIALIIWVARDITSRSISRFYQIICVLIMILFTPFGVLLYLLIRPRKSIYDRCNAEIEGNLDILTSIVQDTLEHKDNSLLCPECSDEIQSDFIVCPNCKASLKDTCHECHKIIREGWSVCPYCEAKQKKKKKDKQKDKDKKSEKKKKTD